MDPWTDPASPRAAPSPEGRPWAALAEVGVKHALRRRDGRPLEGWIEAVGRDELLFASAGPLAPDAPFAVPLADLDPSGASYLDEASGRWVDVAWHETEGRWVPYI